MVDFLRTEDWDPLGAATRLALYWKCRRGLFGDDRWTRPMDQTGHGALSTTDIGVLRSGYAAATGDILLPPTGAPQPYDDNHASEKSKKPFVIISDLSRLPRTAAVENARLQFYYATILTDAQLQTDGVLIVQVVTGDRRPALEMDGENWIMMASALPMRVRGVVIGQAHEVGKERLIESYADQYQLITQFKTGKNIPILKADSTRGVYDLFRHHTGVGREQLPPSLGGSYQYAQFTDWIRMRLSVEAGSVGVPRLVGRHRPLALPTRRVDNGPPSRNQALPLIHGVARMSLFDTVQFLTRENRRLRNENTHLEKAIEQARDITFSLYTPNLPCRG